MASPQTAGAQAIPSLQAQVTDLTRGQVLTSGRAQIDGALTDLLQRENVQLFVLFVDSTGGRSVTAYADTVADQNSLGGNDALLVVAVGDRTDAMWRSSQALSRLTDRELDNVLTRQVEPLLARGDFPGAVVAAANGVAAVAGEGSPSAGQPSGGGAGAGLSRLLPALALGGGGLLAWRAFSGRRRKSKATAQRRQEEGRLEHEANSLLIAADESLRDAREEIGFAEAQFAEADVAPYREAVARSTDELTAAFALRQQLDDAEPEDPETRHRLLEEMIERAHRVQALLEEQAQRLAGLRDLERTAPETLASLPSQLDALEARIPMAERTLAGLERYAERSRASVMENINAARQLITGARTAVDDGQKALAAADRAGASRFVRGAQQTIAEAGQLLDAIDNLAASLRQAEMAAGTQVAAATADLQSARAAATAGGRTDLNGRMAEVESLLRQAEDEIATARPDYPTALRLVAQADGIADSILAELRQEEERREREARMLTSQLQATETDLERVADFIAARRRLIGSAARTRLAEAERHLDRARAAASADPAGALAEARRAQDLADDAYARAVEDVEAYEPYGGGWGGPGLGGVVFPMPIPFPIPMGGGGVSGGMFGGGGIRAGGGGRSVGGRW